MIRFYHTLNGGGLKLVENFDEFGGIMWICIGPRALKLCIKMLLELIELSVETYDGIWSSTVVPSGRTFSFQCILPTLVYLDKWKENANLFHNKA